MLWRNFISKRQINKTSIYRKIYLYNKINLNKGMQFTKYYINIDNNNL